LGMTTPWEFPIVECLRAQPA